MNEDFFWNVIEQAWIDSPEINARRLKAIERNRAKQLQELGDLGYGYTMRIVENLKRNLRLFGKDELTGFIRMFEQKLFALDREELSAAMNDPSGDGFLYCRCFVVGMGKQYYGFIDAQPQKAKEDTSAELFGFVGYMVYEAKFGEEFDRNRLHCIESYSNREGWNSPFPK